MAVFVAFIPSAKAAVDYQGLGEAGSVYATILLLFPLAYAVYTSIITQRIFYLSFYPIATFSFFIAIFWLSYIGRGFDESYAWKPPLFVALFLVAFIFYLSARIIDGGKFLWLNASSFSDLRNHPLTAIACFLVLFLQVTYLLTFSLAFHDKNGKGLFVEFPSGRLASGEKKPSPVIVKKVWFQQGSSHVSFLGPQLNFGEQIGPPICEQLDDSCQKQNCRTISEIMNTLGSGENWRITLVGHANDRAPNGVSYYSNYELSWARASNVRGLLETLVEAAPQENGTIQWSQRASSDEAKGFVDGANQEFNPCHAPQLSKPGAALTASSEIPDLVAAGLSVEIVLEQQKRRSTTLLDYIYFLAYTITTTGYGDMIPTSPESKLITTLANFIELCFLVVFFNVLVSHSGDKKA